MKHSVDYLYSFSKGEFETDRYLFSFYNENNELKQIEVDMDTKDGKTYMTINQYESDTLSEDEKDMLYYLLDRWAINNLI